MSAASEKQILQTIERFWETFPQVWQNIRGINRDVAAQDFDITFEQFHVLRLVHRGVCSVSELAEEKGISRPAVSQAVDLLVERGMLTRQQSTGDRRFFSLALTESGNHVVETIFQKNRAWMKEQLSCLSSAEIEAILLGLDALQKAFVEPK